MSNLLIAVTGCLVGVLGGLFGIGGGLFSVVVLATLFRYPQVMAQGISTISGLPCAAINVLVYGRAGDIHWQTGLLLALGGFFTIPFGVRLAVQLKERMLRLLFGGLAAVSSISLLAHR